jgi:hypothetical protein
MNTLWVSVALGAIAASAITAEPAPPGPCSPPDTHGPVSLPGMGGDMMNGTSWSGYARVSPSTALFYHVSEATSARTNQTAPLPPLVRAAACPRGLLGTQGHGQPCRCQPLNGTLACPIRGHIVASLGQLATVRTSLPRTMCSDALMHTHTTPPPPTHTHTTRALPR